MSQKIKAGTVVDVLGEYIIFFQLFVHILIMLFGFLQEMR